MSSKPAAPCAICYMSMHVIYACPFSCVCVCVHACMHSAPCATCHLNACPFSARRYMYMNVIYARSAMRYICPCMSSMHAPSAPGATCPCVSSMPAQRHALHVHACHLCMHPPPGAPRDRDMARDSVLRSHLLSNMASSNSENVQANCHLLRQFDYNI